MVVQILCQSLCCNSSFSSLVSLEDLTTIVTGPVLVVTFLAAVRSLGGSLFQIVVVQILSKSLVCNGSLSGLVSLEDLATIAIVTGPVLVVAFLAAVRNLGGSLFQVVVLALGLLAAADGDFTSLGNVIIRAAGIAGGLFGQRNSSHTVSLCFKGDSSDQAFSINNLINACPCCTKLAVRIGTVNIISCRGLYPSLFISIKQVHIALKVLFVSTRTGNLNAFQFFAIEFQNNANTGNVQFGGVDGYSNSITNTNVVGTGLKAEVCTCCTCCGGKHGSNHADAQQDSKQLLAHLHKTISS